MLTDETCDDTSVEMQLARRLLANAVSDKRLEKMFKIVSKQDRTVAALKSQLRLTTEQLQKIIDKLGKKQLKLSSKIINTDEITIVTSLRDQARLETVEMSTSTRSIWAAAQQKARQIEQTLRISQLEAQAAQNQNEDLRVLVEQHNQRIKHLSQQKENNALKKKLKYSVGFKVQVARRRSVDGSVKAEDEDEQSQDIRQTNRFPQVKKEQTPNSIVNLSDRFSSECLEQGKSDMAINTKQKTAPFLRFLNQASQKAIKKPMGAKSVCPASSSDSDESSDTEDQFGQKVPRVRNKQDQTSKRQKKLGRSTSFASKFVPNTNLLNQNKINGMVDELQKLRAKLQESERNQDLLRAQIVKQEQLIRALTMKLKKGGLANGPSIVVLERTVENQAQQIARLKDTIEHLQIGRKTAEKTQKQQQQKLKSKIRMQDKEIHELKETINKKERQISIMSSKIDNGGRNSMMDRPVVEFGRKKSEQVPLNRDIRGLIESPTFDSGLRVLGEKSIRIFRITIAFLDNQILSLKVDYETPKGRPTFVECFNLLTDDVDEPEVACLDLVIGEHLRSMTIYRDKGSNIIYGIILTTSRNKSIEVGSTEQSAELTSTVLQAKPQQVPFALLGVLAQKQGKDRECLVQFGWQIRINDAKNRRREIRSTKSASVLGIAGGTLLGLEMLSNRRR